MRPIDADIGAERGGNPVDGIPQTAHFEIVVRCYGASGDDIASIGKLLTKRWLHRRRCKRQPMETIDAQAEEAEEAAQRPEPFAYTV
jgi:hypothetical protein